MTNSSRDVAIHPKAPISLDSSYLDRGLKLQEELERDYFHCTHVDIAGNRLLLVEWPIVERVSRRYNEVWSTSRLRKFAVHSFSVEGEYIESDYFPLLDFKDLDIGVNDTYSSLNFVGGFLVLYESVFQRSVYDPSEEAVAHIFDLAGTLKAVMINSERIIECLPSSHLVAKNLDVCMDLPSGFRFRKLGRYSTQFFNANVGYGSVGYGSTLYLYDQLPWLNSTNSIEFEGIRSCLQNTFRLTREIRDAHCDQSGIWILEEDGLLCYQRIASDPENDPTSGVAFTHCEDQLLQFYLAGTAEVLALDRSIAANTIPPINEGRFSYFFIDSQQQIKHIEIHLQEMIRGYVLKDSKGSNYSIEELSVIYDLSNGLLSFSAQTSRGIPCAGTINLLLGQINAFFPEVPKARRLWSQEGTTVWVDD